MRVIDSHTGGEPTRVIIDSGPDLGTGSLADRREKMRTEFDHFRTALLSEPRGSDVMVGAILLPPTDPDCVAGVIYFNNVGYLNMCGHATIGVAVTLAYLDRISPGMNHLETPVGKVGFEYHGNNRVTLENVPSYRHRKSVPLDVPGVGKLTGDVVWGGNWFFLSGDHGLPISLEHVEELTTATRAIRKELENQGITGEDGGEIDHIELFVPSETADARSFVLCPGGVYDRSPCGTGTSAKVACLAEDDRLQPGETYRQESPVGSVFEGTFRREGASLIPRVTGTAYVNGDCHLILDETDPFCWGIGSARAR